MGALPDVIADGLAESRALLTPVVSKAARLGLDLRTLGWHKQPKFDAGRKIFHFEHGVTVSELRELCMRQRTAHGVLRVLTTKPRIVRILKKEYRRLTNLGYRSKRPDLEAAYLQAGIAF